MTIASKTEPDANALPSVPRRSRWHIQLRATPDETIEQVTARMAARGITRNATTVVRFTESDFAELALMDVARELSKQGDAVNRGDLSTAERMLTAQAAALNAIFGEMARRAALNMGEHLNATEAYMRLALKAQAQCRATVQALSEMKNPHPVAFVRQANIANGPQQVNNVASGGRDGEPSRAGNSETEPIKLSGAQHELYQNAGASSMARGANPEVESVGAVHRTQDAGR